MKWGIGSIFLLIRHWVGCKKRRPDFISTKGGMVAAAAAASPIIFFTTFSSARLQWALFSVLKRIYDCIV
jgi:hypothetical protein